MHWILFTFNLALIAGLVWHVDRNRTRIAELEERLDETRDWCRHATDDREYINRRIDRVHSQGTWNGYPKTEPPRPEPQPPKAPQ